MRSVCIVYEVKCTVLLQQGWVQLLGFFIRVLQDLVLAMECRIFNCKAKQYDALSIVGL